MATEMNTTTTTEEANAYAATANANAYSLGEYNPYEDSREYGFVKKSENAEAGRPIGTTEQEWAKDEAKRKVDEAISDLTLKFDYTFGIMDDTEVDTGIDLPDSLARILVGMGSTLQDSTRGIAQLVGEDEAAWQQEARYMDDLREAYPVSTMTGEVAGYFADPVGWALGAGVGKAAQATKAVLAGSKVASVAANVPPILRTGAAMSAAGAGWGALGYVDEGGGETRLGNAVAGAGFGFGLGVVGHAVAAKLASRRGNQAAGKLAEHNQTIADWESEVAERVAAGMTRQQAHDDLKETMPHLAKAVVKAVEETGYTPNVRQAYIDLPLRQAEARGTIPLDMLPSSEKELNRTGLGRWLHSSNIGKLAHTLDKYTDLLSSRVKKISPRIFGKLRTFEAAIKTKPLSYLERARDFADMFELQRWSPLKRVGVNAGIPESLVGGRKIRNEMYQQFTLTPKENNTLNFLLLNSKRDEALDYMEDLNGKFAREALSDAMQVLDDLGEELVASGIIKQDELIEGFWPRFVPYENRETLAARAFGKDQPTKLSKEWATYLKSKNAESQKKRGSNLSAVEEGRLFQEWFLKKASEGRRGVDVAKRRQLPEVKDGWVDLYANPLDAFEHYVYSAVEEIQKAKFFGKDVYLAARGKGGDAIFDVNKAVDETLSVDEALATLSIEDQEELREMLTTRFAKATQSTPELVRAWKNLVHRTLLTNPLSALTQVQDLAMSFNRNGILSTTKTLVNSIVHGVGKRGAKLAGKQKFANLEEYRQGVALDVENAGLALDRFAEFQDLTKDVQGKILTNVLFKYSGFSWVDNITKETFMTAALDKALRLTRKPTGMGWRRWSQEQRAYLGAEGFSKLVRDLEAYDKAVTNASKGVGGIKSPEALFQLRKQHMTDEMIAYLFSELSEVQPISLSEMHFLSHSATGKTLTILKSFMLKQLDYAKNQILRKIAKGAANLNHADAARRQEAADLLKEGTLGLAGYVTWMSGLGMTVDFTKDWVLGRKEMEEFPEEVQRALAASAFTQPNSIFAEVFEVFGISRWTMQKVQAGSAGDAVADIVMPPLPFVGEVMEWMADAYSPATTANNQKFWDDTLGYVPWVGRFIREWRKSGGHNRPMNIGEPPINPTLPNKPATTVEAIPAFAEAIPAYAEGGEVVKPESTTDIQRKLDQGVSPHELSVHRGNAGDVLPQATTNFAGWGSTANPASTQQQVELEQQEEDDKQVAMEDKPVVRDDKQWNMTHTPEESFGQGQPIATAKDVVDVVGQSLLNDMENGFDIAKKVAPSLIPFWDAKKAIDSGDAETFAQEMLFESLGALGDLAKLGGAAIGAIIPASRIPNAEKVWEQATKTKSELDVYRETGLYYDPIDKSLNKLIVPQEFQLDMQPLAKPTGTPPTIDQVVRGGHWDEVWEAAPELKKTRIGWINLEAEKRAGMTEDELLRVAAEYSPVDSTIYLNPLFVHVADEQQVKSAIVHEFNHGSAAFFNLSQGRGSQAYEALLSREEVAQLYGHFQAVDTFNSQAKEAIKANDEQLAGELLVKAEEAYEQAKPLMLTAYSRYRLAWGEVNSRYLEGLFNKTEDATQHPVDGMKSMLAKEEAGREPWSSKYMEMPPGTEPKQYSGQWPEEGGEVVEEIQL